MKLVPLLLGFVVLFSISGCDRASRSAYVLDYLASNSLITKHPDCVVVTMTDYAQDNSFIVSAPIQQFLGGTPQGPSMRELGANDSHKKVDKIMMEHAQSSLREGTKLDFDWSSSRIFYFVPKDRKAGIFIAKSKSDFVLILIDFQ